MDAVCSAKMLCLMSGGQHRELNEISGDQSTPSGAESATNVSLEPTSLDTPTQSQYKQ